MENQPPFVPVDVSISYLIDAIIASRRILATAEERSRWVAAFTNHHITLLSHFVALDLEDYKKLNLGLPVVLDIELRALSRVSEEIRGTQARADEARTRLASILLAYSLSQPAAPGPHGGPRDESLHNSRDNDGGAVSVNNFHNGGFEASPFFAVSQSRSSSSQARPSPAPSQSGCRSDSPGTSAPNSALKSSSQTSNPSNATHAVSYTPTGIAQNAPRAQGQGSREVTPGEAQQMAHGGHLADFLAPSNSSPLPHTSAHHSSSHDAGRSASHDAGRPGHAETSVALQKPPKMAEPEAPPQTFSFSRGPEPQPADSSSAAPPPFVLSPRAQSPPIDPDAAHLREIVHPSEAAMRAAVASSPSSNPIAAVAAFFEVPFDDVCALLRVWDSDNGPQSSFEGPPLGPQPFYTEFWRVWEQNESLVKVFEGAPVFVKNAAVSRIVSFLFETLRDLGKAADRLYSLSCIHLIMGSDMGTFRRYAEAVATAAKSLYGWSPSMVASYMKIAMRFGAMALEGFDAVRRGFVRRLLVKADNGQWTPLFAHVTHATLSLYHDSQLQSPWSQRPSVSMNEFEAVTMPDDPFLAHVVALKFRGRDEFVMVGLKRKEDQLKWKEELDQRVRGHKIGAAFAQARPSPKS